MKASKLFTYSIVIVLALFLQSCKSDSKDPQAAKSTQTKPQSQTRIASPKMAQRDTLDATSNAKIQKVIENTNRKIEQTEKEVDKLLEGI